MEGMISRYVATPIAKLGIVCITLWGAIQPSNATTIKEYIVRTSDPETRHVMEMYAIGVGQGFFWYEAASHVLKGATIQQRLFCLPDKMPFTGAIILSAAQRATEKSAGEDSFELGLLKALMEMFPCN